MLGLPLLLYYAAAVVIVAHLLLETTTFGGDVRAIGGNREAASNAGIDVRRISTVVYVLSGLSAAFAGVLMSARLGSGQPSIGVGFELQVISAVIIGGTSLFGGIGTVWGSLLGSLVLSILTTGLILLHIDPVLQDFVIGVIIVAAVGIDQFRRRQHVPLGGHPMSAAGWRAAPSSSPAPRAASAGPSPCGCRTRAPRLVLAGGARRRGAARGGRAGDRLHRGRHRRSRRPDTAGDAGRARRPAASGASTAS